MKLPLFLIIIFFSACLLFQIQPMLTKELLPLFGGSATVWSASLLFFQSILFFGYLYAHLLSKLQLKSQCLMHALLLGMSVFFTFKADYPDTSQSTYPAFQVILILIQQIGLAFFLLASTSVLLQKWFFKISNRDVPYHWYSLSNLGSLIALISYPLFVEVNFPVSQQKTYWLAAFGILVILKFILMTSIKSSELPIAKTNKPENKNNIAFKTLMLWTALSATGTLMLIATTHMLSTNIPPMPFVWILPLVIYLVSYTYSFSSQGAYKRSLLSPFLLFAIAAGLMMYFVGSQFNAISQLAMFSFILLICCLVCHGELRAHAPNDENMTLFYVAISLGGALGSVFSTFLAPLLFQRLTEYVLGLLCVLLLFVWCSKNKQTSILSIKAYAGWSVAIGIFAFVYLNVESSFSQFDVENKRNFYGYLSVKDIRVKNINERRLIDGTTVHGSQPLTHKSNINSSYYHAGSGIAHSFSYLHQKDNLNIGVIGLGAGVLASYSRLSDKFSFYELNPAVYEMASKYFTYLDDAKGAIEVTINDGRIALTKRENHQDSLFDALIIDAFSSDVIPAHLLTQEAFELYWQNLKQDGLLILHISNNHIDLMPVLQAHKKQFKKGLIQFQKLGEQKASFASDWVVLTSDERFLTTFNFYKNDKAPKNIANSPITWTDQHYSLLPLIKF